VRILHVNHSANPAGGGPIEAIKQLAGILNGADHSVELLCLDSPEDPWLADCAFPVHAVGPSSRGYGYTSKLIPWLTKRRLDYDAVIINGLWQFSGFGTWLALRKFGQPYFVFPHGMLDPWFKKRYPFKQLKKWLYWPWAEYRVLRDAAAVLFTCEEERIQARRSFWLYHCNETVVSLGIVGPTGDPDSQRRLFLGRFPDLQHRRLLLFLGRIHEKKGCKELIESFLNVVTERPNLTSDLHLVMAGPAESGYAVELMESAERVGLASRITWTGMLSGDAKWGAFHAAEAFALPSHQENFGIAVTEALACGVPVLISNKVNTYREIEQDGAGLIENAGFPGTARLLQRWVTLDEGLKQSMRSAARRSFETRYEITRAAESLVQVLRSVEQAGCSTHRRASEAGS
jgi:glycosyltransferase involved in cell wall biosynthesis